MKLEQWGQVIGFPNYIVSNIGNVKRIGVTPVRKISKERLLKHHVMSQGYHMVNLFKNGNNHTCWRMVHRLVLEAFLRVRPQGKQCNHIDGNKSNNAIENLEWVTPSENIKHSYSNLGRKAPMGEQSGKAKLTMRNIVAIRMLYKLQTITQLEISKQFNISRACVGSITTRRTWRHIA